MNTYRKTRLQILATVFFTCFTTACVTTAEEGAEAGVLQGVYTAEQAASGRNTFNSVCRTCHIPRDFRAILKQSDDTEALLNDYFDLISTTMPQDSPGGLPPETYMDIMAYLLSLNGFSAADSGN